jgi:hypothetical protein
VPDQDAEKGFTFVDRRRRGDDAAPAPEPAAIRPAPPPPAPPPPARAEPGTSREGLPRADFASFCVMLYSEALVHLGQVPDPMTGQPHRDLEQAQFTIDLLAMLREKTEGNRTTEETAVLDEILANLRMAFVRGGRR